MIALRVADTLPADLDSSIRDLTAQVTSWAGLSGTREATLRHAVHGVLVDLLADADALVAGAAELEAVERRADNHVRTCGRCRWWRRRPCSVYGAIQHHLARLQRTCDSRYRRLIGGA